MREAPRAHVQRVLYQYCTQEARAPEAICSVSRSKWRSTWHSSSKHSLSLTRGDICHLCSVTRNCHCILPRSPDSNPVAGPVCAQRPPGLPFHLRLTPGIWTRRGWGFAKRGSVRRPFVFWGGSRRHGCGSRLPVAKTDNQSDLGCATCYQLDWGCAFLAPTRRVHSPSRDRCIEPVKSRQSLQSSALEAGRPGDPGTRT